MSLANRLALLAAGILVASGAIMGVSYYGAVERSLRSSHEATIRRRLKRVESAIEADFRRGLLRLNAYSGPLGPDAEWRIDAPDGRALWISETGPDNIEREVGHT